ncbi:hypothetical protein RUA4292_04752 [Ruegeria atlantica]|uniref:Uncharacterized protein n=2 Tax=Ruegeria atlantica TaxID=81569 RepID=A0A0P1EJG0_9RHOB|nr:hypothetical protein RUA4292_04752 [Ruegeria atlantica]
MLSILAKSFMIATQTHELDEPKSSDRPDRQKQRWLPESHWWRQQKRANFSQCE